MVRERNTSTIISYHPISNFKTTSAQHLRSIVQRTGDSVYWSKIFDKANDPTFLFLAILWYALYAWDEAFEALYHHITNLVRTLIDYLALCSTNIQESMVLRTNEIELTRELHKVEAHLLHYKQLLQDFRKSVVFVKDTPNPAMEPEKLTGQEREEWERTAGNMCKETAVKEREECKSLMDKEAHNLLSEIERLEGQRSMYSDRLQNVMRLVCFRPCRRDESLILFKAFASVNIEDSRAMKDLTEASLKDSAAMKQVSQGTDLPLRL